MSDKTMRLAAYGAAGLLAFAFWRYRAAADANLAAAVAAGLPAKLNPPFDSFLSFVAIPFSGDAAQKKAWSRIMSGETLVGGA